MRPILAQKIFGDGFIALLNPYGATQLISVGNIGTSMAFFDSFTSGSQAAVQFGTKIYWRSQGSLMEYDTITQTSSLFRSLTDYSPQNHHEHHFGLFISNIGGVWYLSCFYVSGSAAIRVERYNFTAGTWSTSATFASAADNQDPQRKYQFNNNIYWMQGGTCYKFDVSAMAASTIAGFSGFHRGNSMCSFGDGIYLLQATSSTTIVLYQLVGGAWQLVKTIGSGFSQNNVGIPPLLFTDGTNMYALWYQNTAAGWTCYQITSGLVATDITSTVVPSYLNVAGIPNSQFKGWHVDSHIDPSDPEIWLTYTQASTTEGSALGWFRWRGPTMQMQYVGDAGQGGPDYFVSYDWTGGGQYIFSPGEPNVQIDGTMTASSSTPGNVNVPFRVYQSNNVPVDNLVDINMYYATTPHPPRERARITAITPSGTQINDYTVRVAANSGTLWNMEWRAAADDVAVGDNVSVTLYVSKVL